MFTHEESYRRYTQTFTRRQLIPNEHGELVSTLVEPQAPCNHRELDRIFIRADGWDEVIQMMALTVGEPGPRKEREDISHKNLTLLPKEPFVPEPPCLFVNPRRVVPFIFTNNMGEDIVRFEQE